MTTIISSAVLQGIPEVFREKQELVDTIAAFIFIASVGHAAANFAQYDEYAFPPNYPAMLQGERPKDKVSIFSQSTLIQYYV